MLARSTTHSQGVDARTGLRQHPPQHRLRRRPRGPEHSEQQHPFVDPVGPQSDGLPQGQLQDLLGVGSERDVPLQRRPSTSIERSLAEYGIGALTYRVEVDADRGESVGIQTTRPQLTSQGVRQLLGLHADGQQVLRGGGAGLDQGEQQMSRVDGARACLPGRLLRVLHHVPRLAGEPLEHQILLPYFLWTACLVTPSASAISCQDQPSARARST